MRTPGATRLAPEEARAFRTLAARVREKKGLTNGDLIEYLANSDDPSLIRNREKKTRWRTERQVTNALSDADYKPGKPRPLLAEVAVDLWRALGTLPGFCTNVDRAAAASELLRLHYAPWVQRYRAHATAVAAFIPTAEIERFASLLADVLVSKPGISRSKRDLLRGSIADALRTRNREMARSWYGLFGPEIQRQAGFLEKDKSWRVQIGEDVIDLPKAARHIVRESAARAIEVFIPSTVERRNKEKKTT